MSHNKEIEKEADAKQPIIFNTVKRYPFDLNQTAEKRWAPILNDHKHVLPKLKKKIEELLEQQLNITDNSWTYYGLKKLVEWYKSKFMFHDELIYISTAIGLDLTKLVIMQLLYEANSACTCVISKVDGKYHMYRTMDWDMPLLKEITIELEVIRDKKTLCIAPTWVGCVGFFTTFVPSQSYAIAVNYRRTQPVNIWSIVKNIYRLTDMKWPVSYLLRYVSERMMPIGDAIPLLRNASLVSPCYITCFVPNGASSFVITRDTEKSSMRPWEDTKTKSLIQTNMDYDPQHNNRNENILYSHERNETVTRLIHAQHGNWPDLTKFTNDLSQFPVQNEETVYTSIINAEKIVTQI